MNLRLRVLLPVLVFFGALPLRAQKEPPCTATLEGQVLDPTGAAIPQAEITLTLGSIRRTLPTGAEGSYRIARLCPGAYTIRATHPGFAAFQGSLSFRTGQTRRLLIHLAVEKATATVDVSAASRAVDVDPNQNAGQLVLRGDDLNALSDDSEDLANELQMLAGPGAGPSGPQMYIDGFTDGIMPPKQSIREIRVNQNPFSAEYDKIGFGRIEIFTKPGGGHFHGRASINFGNRALTARNPYLAGPLVPDYQQEIFTGNLSGPLSRRASFFLDGQGRITDENAVLNYTALDSGLNPSSVSTALVTPSRRYTFSPRLDYALSPNHTLIVRYSLAHNNAANQGLSPQSFDQASLAYGSIETDQNLQVSESGVFGPSVLHNIRFQFYRTALDQRGISTAPELDVQGAFTAGGSFPRNFTHRNRYELQDNTTIAKGRHTLSVGLRWRGDWLDEQSTSNFNGRFVFSSSSSGLSALSVYQQNQRLAQQGLSQQQIAAMGFGPSQFLLTTGQPEIGVSQADGALFAQDDWRLRSNLSLSMGLRYETQTAIDDTRDFAPRLAISWAPDPKSSKTVLRAGSGIFYDRFTSDLIWNAARQDGIRQTQYILRNPAFYPDIPNPATLAALARQQGSTSARAAYRIDPSLRVPRLVQTAVSLERSLGRATSLALTYTNTRGWHELRTRDINAPLPTVVDSDGLAAGPRPLGEDAGDLYQYEGGGVFRENQIILNARTRIGSLNLFGYYVYSRAMSDTDGPDTFPSNPYNLRAEYGRAAFDFRHRAFLSGSVGLPLRVQMASFIFLQSGMPYNLTSGVDTNNDGNLNDDRPAYAQGSRASVVTASGFGSFDTSPLTLPNAAIVPRNSLEGPGILALTVRLTRTWSFGAPGHGSGMVGGSEIRGGGSIANGGLSGGSSQSGIASVFGGAAARRPYNLTLSANFRNALNNVNGATPVGSLSSPYFGRSISLNTFGPLPGAGPNAGAGNRHIELQATFSF